MSRVSAYDWLGSIAMTPLALAAAGPAADAFGRTPTLWGTTVLIVALTAAVLLLPDVRRLERREARPAQVGVPLQGASPAPGPAAQPTVKAPSGGSGEGAAEVS
jgi:uncharacterized membrane protein YbhN (UPF0104 family)